MKRPKRETSKKSKGRSKKQVYSLWLGEAREVIYRSIKKNLKSLKLTTLIYNFDQLTEEHIRTVESIDSGFNFKVAMLPRSQLDLGAIRILRNKFRFDLILDSGSGNKELIDQINEKAAQLSSLSSMLDKKSGHFIKEIDRVDSLESFFTILRDEIIDSSSSGKGYSDSFMLIKQGAASELFYHSSVSMRVIRVSCTFNEASDLRRLIADTTLRPVSRIKTLLQKKINFEEKDLEVLILVEVQGKSYQESGPEPILKYKLENSLAYLPKLIGIDDLKRKIGVWREAFDQIDQPVVVLNESYQVLRANRSFSKHATSGPCYKQFAGRSGPCVGCPMGENPKSTVEKDQSHFEVLVSPIESNTEHSYYAHHYIDVTERDKLYSRLVQSEKMVAIGKLVGNIAHELNNPLSGISSLSEILAADTLDKEQKEDFLAISEAAKRSSKIVLDLLSYINDSAETDLSSVDLNVAVTGAFQFIKSLLKSHGYNIDLYSSAIPIRANLRLLQQVIINLVSNAVHATPKGGKIKISTDILNDEAVLVVSDEGKGIPSNDLEKIFEPFYTTKPIGSGTGLGLSFCKNIVAEMHGRIDVSSVMSKGSEFRIYLPLQLTTTDKEMIKE